jgi:hypothetical protein
VQCATQAQMHIASIGSIILAAVSINGHRGGV